ncbi:hypothetical protein JCM3766R1_000935 [Sporobolomyces carnicolor]
MTFRSWIHQSSWAKALMILASLFVAPLVVFAYKYNRGDKLEHWIFWVIGDAVLYLFGIGGLTPIMQGAQALWNGSLWLQIGVQAVVPYVLAAALALFVIYQVRPSRVH